MTVGEWWRRGVVYQIYPRSFADSNGDGVGDLRGIEAHLDYLVHLGIDAIWLSPIYPSPMADFGYDVSDYCDVDPLFGTLADFDSLVSAVHARGLKLILDYVPNHTADRHPWFVAARSARTDAKRDWYLWHDPAPGGGSPNNWLARFGGSAWTFDAATGQYYLHSFLPQQPDLNWRNPEVRKAMIDVLRFWLDRGVDGFRVDVLWVLIKDDLYRDDPPNPDYRVGMSENDRVIPTYSGDRPEVHDIVREMRAVLDGYDDRVLIGEIYLPIERLVTFYGKNLDEAQLPFNFQLILTSWNATAIANMIREYEAALPAGAWPNYVLGNHDNSRIATRIGSDQARVAAVLLLTLRGTPTMYYGEELGMVDVTIPADRVRDPAELRQPGIGEGRDPERTPMPWNGSANRGFSTAVPWLPYGDGEIDVDAQSGYPDSMLSLVRQLLEIRRAHAALRSGLIEAVHAEGDVLSFQRRDGNERICVLLNLSAVVRDVAPSTGIVLVSSYGDHAGDAVATILILRPNEAIICLLSCPNSFDDLPRSSVS